MASQVCETFQRKQCWTAIPMQLGELLSGLERCLDSLGGGQVTGNLAEDECRAEKQFAACCTLLQQAADHASTSDFIRQVILLNLQSCLLACILPDCPSGCIVTVQG